MMEDVYVAGFVCTDFSMQNPQRFQRDCISESNPDHMVTLLGCLQHIRRRSPEFFVLENVQGLKPSPQTDPGSDTPGLKVVR